PPADHLALAASKPRGRGVHRPRHPGDHHRPWRAQRQRQRLQLLGRRVPLLGIERGPLWLWLSRREVMSWDALVQISFGDLLMGLAKLFLVTLAFTAMGLLAFAIAFLIIVKVTPFSIRKEIEEDQNIAFAIVIGSVIVGVA